jgi:hypothetical protein
MKKLTLSTLYLLITHFFLSQSISFVGENINITIRHDSVTVEAMYFFRSEQVENIMVFFPLPGVGDGLQIGSVEVFSVNQGNFSEYEMGPDGLRFGITVIPGEEARYRVKYRQKRSEEEFRYILTSTRNWGEALQFSHISVDAPKSYPAISSFSYEPAFTQDMGKRVYYEWNFRDFMPEEDFVVSFE